VLVDQDLAAVAHRDAGGRLAAVLEGVQAEVGQLRDLLAGGPHPEDATRVLRSLVLRVEGGGQPAVAALARAAGVRHGVESTGAPTLVPFAGLPRVCRGRSAGWPLPLTCVAPTTSLEDPCLGTPPCLSPTPGRRISPRRRRCGPTVRRETPSSSSPRASPSSPGSGSSRSA